jgi:hypothetical protein
MGRLSRKNFGSFDSDAFGQVAGLVNISALQVGYKVGKKLKRDGVDERLKVFAHIFNFQGIIEQGCSLAVSPADKADDSSAAGLSFEQIGDNFFELAASVGQSHNRHLFINESNGPMLHLAGGITFSMDI